MKWAEYILNACFWLVTAWLISSSFSIQAQELEIINGVETLTTVRNSNLLYQILTCIVISCVLFYASLWNLQKLNHTSSKAKIGLTTVFLFLLAVLILNLIGQLFFAHDFLLPNQLSWGILLFYLTISTGYGIVKVWIQSEQRQKDLIVAARQAELTLLRNQLQPHFLFNALNNLLSLVDQKQNPRLSDSIDRLSQLLRHVIEETQTDKTTLAKEIKFLQNYCKLQALRFEDNELNVVFDVRGSHTLQPIEPGLFIPFVENAIKFGVEPEIHARIDIAFDLLVPNKIDFRIRNKVMQNLMNMDTTGTGIQAVKERLALVYPNQHSLEIKQDDDYFVHLIIHTH